MDAGTLHAEIAKVCPVLSVRIGVADDRTTWSFEPGEAATEPEIAAGQNVIDTIPVDFKPPPTPSTEEQVIFDHENRLRSMEGQPPLTLADFVTKTLKK